MLPINEKLRLAVLSKIKANIVGINQCEAKHGQYIFVCKGGSVVTLDVHSNALGNIVSITKKDTDKIRFNINHDEYEDLFAVYKRISKEVYIAETTKALGTLVADGEIM